MKKLKFLTLTDHSGHSKENSVYAILNKLSLQGQCELVDVASRGDHRNAAFFNDLSSTRVYAKRVEGDFDFDPAGKQFTQAKRQVVLADYDAILMRLPRPVTTEFMAFLSKEAANKVIVNDPKGIEKTGSKAFLLNFPELCPSIRLCHSIGEILDFSAKFPIVLKPLEEYGGKGLLKIDGDTLLEGNKEHDTKSYLATLNDYIEREGFLAMKFMKNVSQGDKRILVVGGEILAASLRLPAKGSWLCNVAQGGSSVSTEITPEEEHIVKTISPRLKEEGILVFGADTLVNDEGKRILSEVNTLSIGGFPQAEKQTGKPILQMTVQKIINYVYEKSQ